MPTVTLGGHSVVHMDHRLCAGCWTHGDAALSRQPRLSTTEGKWGPQEETVISGRGQTRKASPTE